jgi:hypothetical protein
MCVQKAFLAVTNRVSPVFRGLAAASPNRVTKRVAADFYPAKGKNHLAFCIWRLAFTIWHLAAKGKNHFSRQYGN